MHHAKEHGYSRVRSALPLDAWRTIENYSVSIARGKYRPTNHAYKIVFN